jgi:NAD(P)-dependent dehydrogenase (short-subunit alcohol dehydrogenase family)
VVVCRKGTKVTSAGEQPLIGKRVLITGASSGIGAAIARALATRGAELVLAARGEKALAQVASSLDGGPHSILALDVRDEAAWKSAREVIAPKGSLDAVVTAAARLGPIGPLGSWDIREFRDTLDLNVSGTLLAVLASLEGLRLAQGSVITFSGGGATAPMPRYDAYAASKAAVVRLTENLATDLAEYGIRANSVAPGFVLTTMHNDTIAAGADRVGKDYFEKTRSAMSKGGGDSPELAAELVAFLVSDQSRGITGKLLSARWDPWRESEFRERLRSEKDLATLRRIDDQFYTSVGASDR